MGQKVGTTFINHISSPCLKQSLLIPNYMRKQLRFVTNLRIRLQILKNIPLKVCGDDQYCLFDVAATGDLSIGEVTKKITEEVEEIEEILTPSNQYICVKEYIYDI